MNNNNIVHRNRFEVLYKTQQSPLSKEILLQVTNEPEPNIRKPRIYVRPSKDSITDKTVQNDHKGTTTTKALKPENTKIITIVPPPPIFELLNIAKGEEEIVITTTKIKQKEEKSIKQIPPPPLSIHRQPIILPPLIPDKQTALIIPPPPLWILLGFFKPNRKFISFLVDEWHLSNRLPDILTFDGFGNNYVDVDFDVNIHNVDVDIKNKKNETKYKKVKEFVLLCSAVLVAWSLSVTYNGKRIIKSIKGIIGKIKNFLANILHDGAANPDPVYFYAY